MRKIIVAISIALFSSAVIAATGTVVREDVCGSGNSIIETRYGYIAAEYYSGVYLYEGDVVYGRMEPYDFQVLTRNDGRYGDFYLAGYESYIDDTYEELCD